MINPDAHRLAVWTIGSGITVARRGWLTKADVWNTGSLKTMIGRIDRLHGRA